MSRASLSTALEKTIMENAFARDCFGAVRSFAASDAIALTFDDGPDPKYTPLLLDLLAQFNAKATFFVVGERAAAHPSILADIRDRGHAIGNHSYHHFSFTYLSWKQRIDEIKKCEQVIGATPRKLFRPPYGHLSRLSPLVASLLGYDTVCWSVDSHDWVSEDADWMFENLKQQTTGGSVILLHDRIHATAERRYFDRKSTLNLTSRFLGYFSGAYRFITVADMFKEAKPERVDWDIAITEDERELRKVEISQLIINSA